MLHTGPLSSGFGFYEYLKHFIICFLDEIIFIPAPANIKQDHAIKCTIDSLQNRPLHIHEPL